MEGFHHLHDHQDGFKHDWRRPRRLVLDLVRFHLGHILLHLLQDTPTTLHASHKRTSSGSLGFSHTPMQRVVCMRLEGMQQFYQRLEKERIGFFMDIPEC